MATRYTLNVRRLGPCPVIRHACCYRENGPITALVRAPSGEEIEVHWSDCEGGGLSVPYYGPGMRDRGGAARVRRARARRARRRG